MIAFFRKRENMKPKVRANILERELFHGTDPTDVDKICKQNFDWRLCGKNASVYGAGSYFAVNASYSDDYARRNVSGSRYSMFLAKVLVGSYVQGDQSYKRPPSKNPSNPTSDLYDSCVDNEFKPEIFVVFGTDQCYPSYVIEYEDVGCYGVALSQPSPAVSGGSVAGYRPQVAGYSSSSGYRPQAAGYSSSSGYRPQAAGYSSSSGYRPQAAGYSSSSGYRPQAAGYSSSSGYRPQAAGYRTSAPSTQVRTSSSASSGSSYQHTSSSARSSAPSTRQASGSTTSFGASSSTSSGSYYQHTSSSSRRSTPSPPRHPTKSPATKDSPCVIS